MEIAVDMHDVYVITLEKWDVPNDLNRLESDHCQDKLVKFEEQALHWAFFHKIHGWTTSRFEEFQTSSTGSFVRCVQRIRRKKRFQSWNTPGVLHDDTDHIDMTITHQRPRKWKKWRKIPWSQVVHTIFVVMSVLFAWIAKCKKIEKNLKVRPIGQWRWWIHEGDTYQ